MALKLRVISDQYQQLGKLGSRLFGVTGGRIGRSDDNDWVLPDPERYISSHHAAIRHQSGRWILEDTSTNGIFINDANTPLSQHGPYALKDGDHIRMGDYDILVSLDDRVDFPIDSKGPPPAPAPVKARPRKPSYHNDHDNLNAEIDINALLSGEAQSASAASGQFAVGNAYGVGAQDNAQRTTFRPYKSAVAHAEVEDKASNTGLYENIPLIDTPPPAVAATPTPPVEDWHLRTRRYQKSLTGLAPGAAGHERGHTGDVRAELNAGIEAFCRGIGIDPASLPSELQNATLTLAGQMLREVVLGLMEALKNRGEFKGRFDPNQTGMQAADNNPLKVSTSIDDAVCKLLDAHSTRFLGPVEALREAFADLKTHQLAVNSGMHAGLNGLLNRINPADLQDRFDRSLKRGGITGAANKPKYWDLYQEFFQVLNQRNNDGLPLSFHEDFVQTYIEKVSGFRSSTRIR